MNKILVTFITPDEIWSDSVGWTDDFREDSCLPAILNVTETEVDERNTPLLSQKLKVAFSNL